MLKRLYVDNYRNLVNFELGLQEVTLLLGANGVGKTSVLDVVLALRQLLSGVAKLSDTGIFPLRTLTRWQTKSRQVFELEATVESDELVYRLEVEHEKSGRRSRIVLESLEAAGKPLFHFKMGSVQLYRDDHSQGPSFTVDWSESALARVAPGNDNTRLTRFLDFIRKIVVCGLYPASFATEAQTDEPILRRDASNFAAWYWHVLLESPDQVSAYTQVLKDVIDGFAGIRLEKVGLDTRALMVAFEDHGQRFELRLDEVSDGQRALIALYALVRLAGGQGYTLFLDEPDNYVALVELQPWLTELSDACGSSIPQAVLCSHHPELIDYLGSDCGIVLKRESSGAVRATALAEAIPKGEALKLSEIIARGRER